MSIVKLKDKRTGTTYVYESESYWDKEKKQPRSHRKLIGKLDENGEVIPTGKSGRKKGTSGQKEDSVSPEPITEYIRVIEEKDALLRGLKAENKALKKERQEILQALNELSRKLTD